MNNLYKGILIIFFANLIIASITGMTTENLDDVGNSMTEAETELTDEDFVDANVDLSKQFTDNTQPTWSMWKGVRVLFNSALMIDTHGYEGIELTFVRTIGQFLGLINLMAVVLFIRMIRGNQ